MGADFRGGAAHVEIAGYVGARAYLETVAEQRTRVWLGQYRIAIKSLGDERQEEYRQIRAMSAAPETMDLGHPREWLVRSMARELNGVEGATREVSRSFDFWR